MAIDGLEQRIARLPCWQGKVGLEPLKGGLTNISYVATVRTPEGTSRYVVRCGDDIPVHHVFRDRERAVSRAAFEAGLSPEVVYVEPGITVLRFIEGRTFGEADMRANIDRLVPLLKTCHREVGAYVRGPANFFWVFHVIRDYAATLQEDGSRFAAELPRYLELAKSLEAAQVPMPIVFGHHDLLPGNLLDDGKRLWLIDWEYGGFGTAMFDLANLSANGSFEEAEDVCLLDGYFDGKATDELRRAFDAMKVASSLREAMWAMISDIHLKTPGVDYEAHARDYLGRTEAAAARLTGQRR